MAEGAIEADLKLFALGNCKGIALHNLASFALRDAQGFLAKDVFAMDQLSRCHRSLNLSRSALGNDESELAIRATLDLRDILNFDGRARPDSLSRLAAKQSFISAAVLWSANHPKYQLTGSKLHDLRFANVGEVLQDMIHASHRGTICKQDIVFLATINALHYTTRAATSTLRFVIDTNDIAGTIA